MNISYMQQSNLKTDSVSNDHNNGMLDQISKTSKEAALIVIKTSFISDETTS